MRLLLISLFFIVFSPLSRGHNIPLTTTAAAAATATPAPAPAPLSLTDMMSKKGCKLFAQLLAATADVEKTFTDNIGSGLTVFCPNDQAIKTFTPIFKNLTADANVSLLLYQAIPVYNSLSMLKSGNGVVNTLATDGTSKNYNFTIQNEGEQVTLNSGVSTAAITGTVVDKDSLAVYTIDEVLEPKELFKAVLAPSPAPAPTVSPAAVSPPAPAPGVREAAPADHKAADVKASGAAWRGSGWGASVAIVAVVAMAV